MRDCPVGVKPRARLGTHAVRGSTPPYRHPMSQPLHQPPAARTPLFPHLFPSLVRSRRGPVALTVAVAAGGAGGALARQAVQTVWPPGEQGFPWTTLLVNVVGCAAMGVLMTSLKSMPVPPVWAGPLLGTGFLGGFTTFSSYADDIRVLLEEGEPGTAIGYLAATVAAALLAVAVAGTATRHLISRARNGRRPR
ncbi:putative fluoride ion transporter CrcB [Streptomyces sp. ADI96-15]|nr:CrcB protein [Streptomyces sp. PVA_94-07]RPK70432.1 putative fluoride ion transporter CrcB [Streptomyces sp. ADI96-15]